MDMLLLQCADHYFGRELFSCLEVDLKKVLHFLLCVARMMGAKKWKIPVFFEVLTCHGH